MGDASFPHRSSKPSKTILINVQVFNGQDWSHKPVFIDNGKIVEKIGAAFRGALVVDCKRGFLIPGLIDAHVHVNDQARTKAGSMKNLETLRNYGITTCLDMECEPPELLKSLRKLPGLPDLFSAGYAAQYQRLPPNAWPPASSVKDTAAAEAFVVNRVMEGVDYIKMIADPPDPKNPELRGLDLATMKQLVDTAKKCDLLSIAHCITPPGILKALDAGVDIVTHAPLAPALGGHDARNAILRMAHDKRICVPTLTMMKGIAQKSGHPELYENTTKEAAKALHDVGVPLLAGTDAHSVPEPQVPYQPPYGKSLHEELGLLVDVGLTPLEALKAATELPAKYFKQLDRGSIEPGKRADLVLLRENPLENIENTKSVEKVWLVGEMFDVPHQAA